MDYAKFYTDANKALVDSLISTWVPGHKEEQNYLRELLTQKEPLIAPSCLSDNFSMEKLFHDVSRTCNQTACSR